MKYLLILFLLLNLQIFAQHQERTVFLYNVGLGCFTSSIGAVINSPKGSNWKRTFIKAFWQGGIGGVLNYTSKKTLYQIKNKSKLFYALPAKIIHSAGASIIENAAFNQPFLQNWHIDYNFIRFDFSINNKQKFTAKLLPESIYAAYMGNKLGVFNLKQSLITGSLIFINNDNALLTPNGVNYYTGLSYGRAIAVGNWPAEVNKVMAHEIVHQFQYEDYQIFNIWLKPVAANIKSKPLNIIFGKFVYFDAPYFWLPYLIAGVKNPTNIHYFRNFYEFEAERFSTNANVNR